MAADEAVGAVVGAVVAAGALVAVGALVAAALVGAAVGGEAVGGAAVGTGVGAGAQPPRIPTTITAIRAIARKTDLVFMLLLL